jgi:hypothetical protein
MSLIFDVDGDTVWNPATRVGDLYVRLLTEIADVLGVPTGLIDFTSEDTYEIDVDVYGGLVRKIADLYAASPDPVLRGLLEGVLAPSVVVLDRAGRPLAAQSGKEHELIAKARQLSMAR